jgi:heptosyltransferase II
VDASALEDKALPGKISRISQEMLNKKKLPQEGINKILIRGTNWIGDAVMTLPAIASVRATYPQAHLAVLAKPWVADVYKYFSDINETIIYEKKYDNAFGVFLLAKKLKKKNFDTAILLQNAIEAAIIALVAGIPVRAGFDTDGRGLFLTHSIHRSKEIKKVHQADYYLEMVKALGCVSVNKEMHLETKINRADAQAVLDKYIPNRQEGIIGIAPGATFGPAKRWLPDRFAAIADRIADNFPCRIILLGGKSDHDIAEEVRKLARTDLINLAGNTSLIEAMHLISQCRLFISNDSGLMHVAGALNIPTIAIFGSTNPATTAPLGNQSVIIRKPVSCSPCLQETCPTDFCCMKLISVEDLFNAAQRFLSKGKNG